MKFSPLTFSIILTMSTVVTQARNNPLLQAFDNPFQTVPFSQIRIEDYSEALDLGLQEQEKNIQKIIHNPAAASFENTIVALEEADPILTRSCDVLFNLAEAETSDSIDALTQKYSPLLTEASNRIFQNKDLFARVKTVYESDEARTLDTEDRMLLEKTYIAFVRSGANLTDAQKARFSKLSSRLSSHTLQYGQHVLKSTNDFQMLLTTPDELTGLPEFARDAARERAQEKGLEGWLFDLSMPSYVSFMQYAQRRDLREKLYRAYNAKANQGGETDNKNLVRQIVNDRIALAQLMGQPDFASYRLERTMAENKAHVYQLLDRLLAAYKPVAQQEFQEMETYARQQSGNDTLTLHAWDWSYYANQLKEQRYNISDSLLKPYFELERVKQGVFWLAGQLYGLQFHLNPTLEGYHPDVQVYEVTDRDGKHIAILYTDFFPRPSKQGGAWMTEYRGEKNLYGQEERPLISIVMNFTKPIGDTPSLLTYNEVTTLLHEFGHALHGMLADTKYRSLSGTNVYRDFVELPSQFMENYASEQVFLDQVAYHYQTGEKIPSEYIQKIKDSENFHAAYACVRQLNFGYLDMAWHSLTQPFAGSVEEFETQACEATRLFPVVEGCCISTQFSHIFAGGYAAGYYSYKWAEVLDADAFSLFQQRAVLDAATAQSFRDNILSRGGTEHPMVLYKRFRGQEPSIEPLLRRSGILSK